MTFAIAWIAFGLPLGAAVFAARGLCRYWSTEHDRITKLSAILLAISATLLACGATAYVQLVKPLPAFDYSVEGLGLVLSFAGTILGLVTLRSRRWFTLLAFGVSAWMLVLFFLLGSTY